MAVKEWTCSWNPLAWCSFSNNKALPSFSLSLVIFLILSLSLFLAVSLSLSFSLCLSLYLFLYISFFLHQVFRNSALAGDNEKSSSIDFAGHVCAWAWWYLNSRSRQKPGPLAACSFVPSARIRDRHLAFNGDDRSFPLSPNGCVYLISNTVQKATCLDYRIIPPFYHPFYHQFVFTFFIFKRSTRVIIFPRTDDTCCACLRVSLVVRSLRIFKEQSGEEKVLCLSKSRPESSCVWTLSKKFILQVIFFLSLFLFFSSR